MWFISTPLIYVLHVHTWFFNVVFWPLWWMFVLPSLILLICVTHWFVFPSFIAKRCNIYLECLVQPQIYVVLIGYAVGYNGGWPSARLFGWSTADWFQVVCVHRQLRRIVAMVTMVTMGGDLQPGYLADRLLTGFRLSVSTGSSGE